MPDNETPDGDALEQQQDAAGAESASGAGAAQVGFEAPEADSVEQQTPVTDADAVGDSSVAATSEADEGDLAESSREVGYDDDDYR